MLAAYKVWALIAFVLLAATIIYWITRRPPSE